MCVFVRVYLCVYVCSCAHAREREHVCVCVRARVSVHVLGDWACAPRYVSVAFIGLTL